jgi:hypothetical protein
MSSHQGNAPKTDPQAVEMEGRLLDDIVGAGSEPCSFTTYQDVIDATTHYKDEIDKHGRTSTEAGIANARLEDVRSRLHPMDK